MSPSHAVVPPLLKRLVFSKKPSLRKTHSPLLNFFGGILYDAFVFDNGHLSLFCQGLLPSFPPKPKLLLHVEPFHQNGQKKKNTHTQNVLLQNSHVFFFFFFFFFFFYKIFLSCLITNLIIPHEKKTKQKQKTFALFFWVTLCVVLNPLSSG